MNGESVAAGAGCVCARTTPPEKCKRTNTGQSLFKLVVTVPGCITKMKKKRQAKYGYCGVVRVLARRLHSTGLRTIRSRIDCAAANR